MAPSARELRFGRRMIACASVGVTAMLWSGCDGAPLGDLAEQCGLTCPDEGILEGNSKISGIVEVDAFFGAVVDLSSAAASVRAGIEEDLNRLAASLDLAPGASPEQIANALAEHIDYHTDGGLGVEFGETVCAASVDVMAKAAAECDVDVDPGSVEVNCEGSCAVESGVEVDCGASATLTCEGPAPSFACEGTCTGDCSLSVASACDGVCKGTCNGSCSVQDGNGNCAGLCNGTCEGTCELEAGGACNGECHGQCKWVPGDGSCAANTEAHCNAHPGAAVECNANCEGSSEPPAVSAECEATVDAKAMAGLECRPPSISFTWQWSAAVSGDATAQSEFRAWLVTLEQTAASAKGKGIKGDILVDGFAALGEAGENAVRAGAEAALEGDLGAKIGSGCALDELPNATALLAEEGAALAEAVQAVVIILAVLGDGGFDGPGSFDN